VRHRSGARQGLGERREGHQGEGQEGGHRQEQAPDIVVGIKQIAIVWQWRVGHARRGDQLCRPRRPGVTMPGGRCVCIGDHECRRSRESRRGGAHVNAYNLLGFGDEVSILSALQPPDTNLLQSLLLKANVSITGKEYQSKWSAVSDLEAVVVSTLMRFGPKLADVVKGALGAFNVMTMVSGELLAEFKFFRQT
jgi:hypothetical protein